MLPRKTTNWLKNGGIPFHPLKQHSENTNTILKFSECEKPQVVYSKLKCISSELRRFKSVTSNLFYVCGSTIDEFGEKELAEKFFVKANLNC